MSVIQPTRRGRGARYEAIQSGPEFSELRRRFRGFVVPVTALFLAWYFCFVLLAAFAPGFMAIKVLGNINIGLVLGLLQFVSTFAITIGYGRWARRNLDPLAQELREQIERSDLA
jgi:uncharacterized membrane protein (DUF485 family)